MRYVIQHHVEGEMMEESFTEETIRGLKNLDLLHFKGVRGTAGSRTAVYRMKR